MGNMDFSNRLSLREPDDVPKNQKFLREIAQNKRNGLPMLADIPSTLGTPTTKAR